MKQRQPLLRLITALLCGEISSLVAYAAPDDIEAVPQKAVVRNQFFMDDANFDANVFQPHGNAKQARTIMESRLKLQINEINRICKLDSVQEQKLKLAGGADIKHFFDDVDAVRKKFQESKHDQDAWNRIWQEISPLQTKLSSGIFVETSFFQKTLRKTLSEEQRQSYDKVANERKRFRYRATIESVLTHLENSVPLKHAQHEKLANLLFEQTEPPLAFGTYDQFVILYHLSHFPEEKVKPIFDERQWNLLQMQINQARGMEDFMIQNGVLAKPNQKSEMAQAAEPADAGRPENQNKDATNK